MESKTFLFYVTLVPNSPSEPFYTINFDDNTPINKPRLISGLSDEIAHTFESSGEFNVTIIVFNKVSTTTVFLTVFCYIPILFS